MDDEYRYVGGGNRRKELIQSIPDRYFIVDVKIHPTKPHVKVWATDTLEKHRATGLKPMRWRNDYSDECWR